MKTVGRMFEISDSNLIQRKCGDCSRSVAPPPPPQKIESLTVSAEQKKTRKYEICGHQTAENAENAAVWLQCD